MRTSHRTDIMEWMMVNIPIKTYLPWVPGRINDKNRHYLLLHVIILETSIIPCRPWNFRILQINVLIRPETLTKKPKSEENISSPGHWHVLLRD